MDSIVDSFVESIVNVTLDVSNETIRDDILLFKSKVLNVISDRDQMPRQNFYKDMLKAEGKYVGSTMHKSEDLDLRLIWSFKSAVFFSLTVFTTIGYGRPSLSLPLIPPISQVPSPVRHTSGE